MPYNIVCPLTRGLVALCIEVEVEKPTIVGIPEVYRMFNS